MQNVPASLTPQLIFWLNYLSTAFMAGLIWYVQVVHYPLFHQVGVEGFANYEILHRMRTGWVVGLPMLVEAGTAVLLLYARPAWISSGATWLGLALVGIIWIVTAGASIPAHHRLSISYDAAVVNRLVAWNWVRTIGWTLRWLGLSWLLAQRLSFCDSRLS